MSSTASKVDPDIEAAFADKPDSKPPTSHIDDDIAAAFHPDAPKSDAAAPKQDQSWWKRAAKEAYGSYLEPAATMVTGAIAKPVSDVAGLAATAYDAATGNPNTDAAGFKQYVQDKLTYSPKTELGKSAVGLVGQVSDATIGNVARGVGGAAKATSDAFGLPAPAGDAIGNAVIEGVTQAPNFLGARAVAGKAPKSLVAAPIEETQAALNKHYAGQSMGAAASAPDISRATPEIQQKVGEIVKQGGQLTPTDQTVISRHVEADSLPVPVKLTKGQATQDPDVISAEVNNRGATGLSKFYQKQADDIKANVGAIRDQVGPDVFSTNHVEHADTLIQAYKDMDEPKVAEIGQKYQALRDAAGGDFPIDAQTFVNNARMGLKKKLLSNDVPTSVAADLRDFAEGTPMNFEDFESMRTKLAQEMRDNPSGNARTAAGVVRQALEDLPLQPGAAALKPLADTARAAAKARFDALEADPAYKAAVTGSVPPDKFIAKFVTGGERDKVSQMRQNLAGNDTALQTMSVATMDDLRQAAGLNPDGKGKFSQARFDKRLTQLEPKIQSLLPPDAVEHTRTLAKVARLIGEAPEGETINRSNTLSGAIAATAKNVGRSILNVKTGGISEPVLRHAESKLNEKDLAAQYNAATAPLAGVGQK